MGYRRVCDCDSCGKPIPDPGNNAHRLDVDLRCKNQNFYYEGSVTPEIRAAMGDDVKAFFEASMVGAEMRIGERVADRDW